MHDVVGRGWGRWGAFGVDDGEGWDELVGDAGVVELFDAGDGVGVGAAFGVAGDHGVEGLALLLPAEVAVHGEVAAADGGELAGADSRRAVLEVLRGSRGRWWAWCRGRP